MMLTTSAIESMGFTAIPPGETIEAAFYSLHVFEGRGIVVKEAGVVSQKASTSGAQYTLAVGGSVNDICSTIAADRYTQDEDAWAKERKCTPPYAVVYLGPTTLHAVTKVHAKTAGGEIITYDAFGAAREELRWIEAKILPSIEMALACAFSSGGHDVEFKPVDRTVFGVTPSNVTVHDLRITGGRAHLYMSKPFTAEDIESGIKSVVELADSLDPRVSRFFQLGLRDQDDLKRFLYYFLAIEIEVHRVFRTVSRAQHVMNGAILDPRVSTSLARLIENRADNWNNLADRFVWCVVSLWQHLSDDDIEEFKRLKKVRDGIAHGNVASPDRASVLAVEKLAKKIHN